MSTVLQQQLETYAQSVGALDGAAATAARLADDVIDVGLRLYESAKESVRRWHADIASGVSSYEPREAEQYLDLYRTLDRAFDRITPFVDRVVASGAVVEGADRFSRERVYLKATLAISPEKARRAAEQVAGGQVKPAAEVRRELLRRVQP